MIETGIKFDNIHSFTDLRLILSGVDIPPAQPKTNNYDIVGGDGSIDLTETNGEVKFSDRDCKFTFTMNPVDDLSDAAWEAKKSEISNFIAGKIFKITLDKDSGFYYKGRCAVNEYLSNKRKRQFVIAAKVSPYKLKQEETRLQYTLSATLTEIIITNSRKSVVPFIDCTNDNTTVVYGNGIYTLNKGTHKILDILLTEGSNKLQISGSGTVTFRFQEGDL